MRILRSLALTIATLTYLTTQAQALTKSQLVEKARVYAYEPGVRTEANADFLGCLFG